MFLFNMVRGPLRNPLVRPRTAYIYDPTMLRHRAGPFSPDPDHPEAPGRIKGIFNTLVENRLIPQMLSLESRSATKSEILLVHSLEHWNKVEALQRMGFYYLLRSIIYDIHSVHRHD